MTIENKNNNIKIPSKTFLMGEYSVLMGGRALVLAHAPYFEIEGAPPEVAFHKDSPAGKLLSSMQAEQTFTFKDPHDGGGGFGGSTSEYLGTYLKLQPEVQRREIMETYFSYFDTDKTSPSGADLCAQSFLEEGVLEYQKEPLAAFQHKWPFPDMKVLIFKTDQKVKTHEHLDELLMENLGELGNASEEAIEAFVNKDQIGFLNHVNEFTKEQAMRGLLAPESMKLIIEMSKIDGVLGSRGCGAMGADVLALFVQADRDEYIIEQISKKDMGLTFVSSYS